MGRLDVRDPVRDEDVLHPEDSLRRPWLSLREQQFLEGIANGERPKEIAARLMISIHTLECYRKVLYLKLDVHNEALAVRRGFEWSFLT